MKDLDPPELLQLKFGEDAVSKQATQDGIATVWVPSVKIFEVLNHLKSEITRPFLFLYDITAIDERARKQENGYPSIQFTVVYHLYSFGRNSFLRIKAAVGAEKLSLPSATKL